MKAGSSGIIIGDGSNGGGGEIINVQGGGGGRIIKATGGRKDRHSKVYTSKGPRDRRVRLSAHTAIQFYDVQDRLGYDRPSKAVDWLINKAKEAIDNLSSPPPPRPPPPPPPPPPPQQQEEDHDHQLQRHLEGVGDITSCSSLLMPPPPPPPPPDSMMKSLFPMSSAENNLSRTGGIRGDLGLSLQTLHEQFDHPEVNNNNNNNNNNINNINGFIFNSHSIMPRQQLFYNSPIFYQSTRESNNYQNPHMIHSSYWNNNDRQFPSNQETASQSSLFSVHFGSNFQVPARIHGEDDHEQQPSSISQDSQQL